MGKIVWMVSRDGYRESLNLGYCANDASGIESIVASMLQEYDMDLVPNSISINFEMETVSFCTSEDGEEFSGTYFIHKLEVV